MLNVATPLKHPPELNVPPMIQMRSPTSVAVCAFSGGGG